MIRSHSIAVLLALAASAPALAVDTVIVVDLSDQLGTPPGLKTLRYVAQLDDAGARPLSVSAELPAPLEISTNDPLGFRNDAGRLSGQPGDDFPNAPIGEAWDSWVALDSDLLDPNPILLSPNFAGGTIPAIAGTSIVDAGGSWYLIPDPTIDWDSNHIVLGQFTVGETYDVTFNAVLNWLGSDGAIHALTVTPCDGSTAETIDVCPRADLDGDGVIGFTDLTTVLSHWGSAVHSWQPVDGAVHVETMSQPATPRSCAIVRAVDTSGFGSAAPDVSHTNQGATISAHAASHVTLSGSSTVLSVSGDAMYSDDGAVSAIATAHATSELVFDVGAPVMCTLTFTSCATSSSAQLTSDNGFTRLCQNYSGILAPGRYTLSGFAFADDSLPMEQFAVSLMLHDDARGADLDDDGTIGLGDVISILSAWGPCGE